MKGARWSIGTVLDGELRGMYASVFCIMNDVPYRPVDSTA